MFRLIARFVGLWVLAGGFVAAMIDGMKSIAVSSPVTTSALAAWSDLAPTALGALRSGVETRLGATVWQSLATVLSAVPAWGLLALIGSALILIGRRRPEPIGVVP